MARLGSPFVVPLGGEGLSGGKPWVVNQLPTREAEHVQLLRPVRITVRDAESYIDPAQLQVAAGYASVHSNATEVFDKLPRTKRIPLVPGIIGGEAAIAVTSEGVVISKTSSNPQRSVYATAIDAGKGYPSIMVTAVVRPDVVTEGTAVTGPLNTSVYPGPLTPFPFSTALPRMSGAVLGIENGPRKTGVYLWFQGTGASRSLRITGPLLVDASPTPNMVAAYDWSTFHRYIILWNEVTGRVEVYADKDGLTDLIFAFTIASLPQFADDYYARAGGAGDIVAIYGHEGSAGDQSTWSNIAITKDVGYPILGAIRPGDFQTKDVSAELVRLNVAQDPRDADIAVWFRAPSTLFPNPDTVAQGWTTGSSFKMAKTSSGTTFGVYRDEPGFLRSSVDGFMVEAAMVATNTRQSSASSGMGFVIYDGQSVFQITLFNDFATKTVGLRKRYASADDISGHYLPSRPFDWSTGASFRFVVDPRTTTVQIWDASDLSEPLLDMPLNRADFPTPTDMGWVGFTPFIAFGHLSPGISLGVLEVRKLEYCHLYQVWESRTGIEPHHVITNPIFSATVSGSPTLSMVGGYFRAAAPSGTTAKLYRQVPFGIGRGAIVEARLRIHSYRAQHRTGTHLHLEDTQHSYSLTFVENSVGRFAALSRRADIGSFSELVGKDGLAAKLSFPCDWTQFHTYRMERRPNDGLYIFLDAEKSPRLYYPELDMGQLPEVQFGGSHAYLAFGQFSGEGATSDWEFVRGLFSAGYEISFKKNKSDSILRDELFNTQAIVVAHAVDQDA